MSVDQRKKEPAPSEKSTSTKQIEQILDYGSERKPSNSKFQEFYKSKNTGFKKFKPNESSARKFTTGFNFQEFYVEQHGLRQCKKELDKMKKRIEERKLEEIKSKKPTEKEEKAKVKPAPTKENNTTAVQTNDIKRSEEQRKIFYEKYIKKQEGSVKKEECENTTDENDSKLHIDGDESKLLKLVESANSSEIDKAQIPAYSNLNTISSNDYFEDKLTMQRLIKLIQPDVLQQKITSAEIFTNYNQDLSKVGALPESFRDYSSYKNYWLPLFEYEWYSQLISLRKEGAKWKIANLGWSAKHLFNKTHYYLNFCIHTDTNALRFNKIKNTDKIKSIRFYLIYKIKKKGGECNCKTAVFA